MFEDQVCKRCIRSQSLNSYTYYFNLKKDHLAGSSAFVCLLDDLTVSKNRKFNIIEVLQKDSRIVWYCLKV